MIFSLFAGSKISFGVYEIIYYIAYIIQHRL